MQQLSQTFNQGRDVGVPEDVAWISNWIKEYSKGTINISSKAVPAYPDIVESVNRGHIAVAALSDYVNLQLVDGSRPYEWTDPHGLSHIVLVVGYDDGTQAVVVHDPLRIVSGQPADYSWSSFQTAQFYALGEVNGPSLLGSTPQAPADSLIVPAGWQDNGYVLTAPNGIPVVGDFRQWVLSHMWESMNWPLAPARQVAALELSYPSSGPGERQDFRTGSLGQPSGGAVYQIWSGQDMLALSKQLDDSRSEIDQLKQQIAKLQQLPTSVLPLPSLPPLPPAAPSSPVSAPPSPLPVTPPTSTPPTATPPTSGMSISTPSTSGASPSTPPTSGASPSTAPTSTAASSVPPVPPPPGSQRPPLDMPPPSSGAQASPPPSSSSTAPPPAPPPSSSSNAQQPSPPSVHKAQPVPHGSSTPSAPSFDLFALFQRASAYLPLTPAERAFLRLIEGAVCTAIVAAVYTIYQGLNQHLDWHATLYSALAAGGTALLLTFNKYLRAHLDPALDDLITRVETVWNLPTDSSVPPGRTN